MKYLFLSIILLISVSNIQAQSEWQIRIMPQVAFGTKNMLEQPNGEGTRINLNKDFKRKGAAFSPRFEVEYNYRRHHAITTAALLKDRFEGSSDDNILYHGMLFPSGNNIKTVYSFNTYRLGYRYRIVERPRFMLELGATVLLRDAFVSLEDHSQKTAFYNVGVAPLISYAIEWNVTNKISLLSYGDAFAVKAGRAEDLFVGAKYKFTPLISALAGYRLLEGGSDSDAVYTMATFHFLSLGIGFSF